ncbi:flagellar biosynthetic protein FliO [Nitrosomonas sp.]|uniref:flagellar biosynthetic protein FliO n=1 Tax=Nitrosomonas sp. TaxID=42353 RepID=UPI0025EFD35B|nr:flagellar biosynthetic protein FliO [Nitrosomonas sp.]MCC6916758.1 flagellar biosynthetic protein FliO [Nitrosomonas sp.]
MQSLRIRAGAAWWWLLLCLPQPLLAEPVKNQSHAQSYIQPPPVVSTESMLQLSASLLVVLALIALIAWLFKKIGFHPASRTGLLKIISAASVGQREKVVIAEIDDTWLVLGVAPGQVNLLHQMHKKSPAAGEVTESPAANHFAEKLQASLEQNHEH